MPLFSARPALRFAYFIFWIAPDINLSKSAASIFLEICLKQHKREIKNRLPYSEEAQAKN